MLQLLALLIVGPVAVSQPQDEDLVRLVTQTRMDRITDISLSSRGDRFLTHELHVDTTRLWDRDTMRVLRVLEVAKEAPSVSRHGVSRVEVTPSGEHVVFHSGSEIRVD